MSRNMSPRMVVLSTSAIAAIYVAGLTATRGADAGLGASVASAAPITASATPGASSATATATPVVGATATATATSTATATPTQTAAAYKDGTYTGTGTSRRGNVSVSVTVQSGRITNVNITNVTTEYPVSRITALPGQVLSRQNAQVDNVSGATYSAQAFRTAVQQALAQAAPAATTTA